MEDSIILVFISKGARISLETSIFTQYKTNNFQLFSQYSLKINFISFYSVFLSNNSVKLQRATIKTIKMFPRSSSPNASPQSSPQLLTKVHHKRESSVSSSRESVPDKQDRSDTTSSVRVSEKI